MKTRELTDFLKLLLQNGVDLGMEIVHKAQEATVRLCDTYNFLAELAPIKLPKIPESWYRPVQPLYGDNFPTTYEDLERLEIVEPTEVDTPASQCEADPQQQKIESVPQAPKREETVVQDAEVQTESEERETTIQGKAEPDKAVEEDKTAMQQEVKVEKNPQPCSLVSTLPAKWRLERARKAELKRYCAQRNIETDENDTRAVLVEKLLRWKEQHQ